MNLLPHLTRRTAILLHWQLPNMVPARRIYSRPASIENCCWWRGIHLSTSSRCFKWVTAHTVHEILLNPKLSHSLSHSFFSFSAFIRFNNHNDGLPAYWDASRYINWWGDLFGCAVFHSLRAYVQWVLRDGNDCHEASCVLQAKRLPFLSFLGICAAYVDPQDSNIIFGSRHLGFYHLLCHWLWSKCWKVRQYIYI